MQSDPIYMDCRMLQQPTLSVCCFYGLVKVSTGVLKVEKRSGAER